MAGALHQQRVPLAFVSLLFLTLEPVLTNTNPNSDLLETPEAMPAEVKAVLDRHEAAFEEDDRYKVARVILSELEALGYTVDYDLSGELFSLRKIDSAASQNQNS